MRKVELFIPCWFENRSRVTEAHVFAGNLEVVLPRRLRARPLMITPADCFLSRAFGSSVLKCTRHVDLSPHMRHRPLKSEVSPQYKDFMIPQSKTPKCNVSRVSILGIIMT